MGLFLALVIIMGQLSLIRLNTLVSKTKLCFHCILFAMSTEWGICYVRSV